MGEARWGHVMLRVLEELSELGFVVGKSSPCLFGDEKRDLRSVIHGDDITTVGDDGARDGDDDVSVGWETGSEGPSAPGY